MVYLSDAPEGPCSYGCFRTGTFPTEDERGEGMLHPHFDRKLGKERVAQMRTEVAHDRLEARLTREERSAKAAALSEEARLAKARLGEAPIVRGGVVARGTTFVAALFR
jgi:hypothetical protein